MYLITPPTSPNGHPDRLLQCVERPEGAVAYLAESAQAAGWGIAEVDLALLNLALARLKAADANLDTDDAIRRASVMVGARSELHDRQWHGTGVASVNTVDPEDLLSLATRYLDLADSDLVRAFELALADLAVAERHISWGLVRGRVDPVAVPEIFDRNPRPSRTDAH